MKNFAIVAALVGCLALPIATSVRSFAQDAQPEQKTDDESSRKVVNRVVPSYPQLARDMNVRGIVKIEAVVAANGTVKSVDARGGHPLLIQSAETAVRKWKWQTASRESKEVIEIRFDPDK